MIISLCIRIRHYEYALWNVSNHTTVHLNCRKDHIQPPTRKEGWDLFRRISGNSSRNNPNWRTVWREFNRPQTHSSYVTLLNDIIDAEHSSYEEVSNKKGRRLPVQEEWCLGCGICKFHHEVDGNIMGYKAIFVARGFSRKEGRDYKETFAATRSWETWQEESCVKIKEGLVRAQKAPKG